MVEELSELAIDCLNFYIIKKFNLSLLKNYELNILFIFIDVWYITWHISAALIIYTQQLTRYSTADVVYMLYFTWLFIRLLNISALHIAKYNHIIALMAFNNFYTNIITISKEQFLARHIVPQRFMGIYWSSFSLMILNLCKSWFACDFLT